MQFFVLQNSTNMSLVVNAHLAVRVLAGW